MNNINKKSSENNTIRKSFDINELSNRIAFEVIADLHQSLMRGIDQNIKDIEKIKKDSDRGKSLLNDINREFSTVKSALTKLKSKEGEAIKAEKTLKETEELIDDAKLVDYASGVINTICDKMIEVWEVVRKLNEKIYSQGVK